MTSQNKAQLIGYLGVDPQIREYPTGMVRAILRVSTKTRTTQKDLFGNTVFRVTWHKVVMFGKEQVEKLRHNYISGSHVMVEGQLYYYPYVDQWGGRHYMTVIKAYTIINLDR